MIAEAKGLETALAHDSHKGGEWGGSLGDRAVNKTDTVPFPS